MVTQYGGDPAPRTGTQSCFGLRGALLNQRSFQLGLPLSRQSFEIRRPDEITLFNPESNA
jgi:hypothetical protein